MLYDIVFALSLVGNIALLLALRSNAGYVNGLYIDLADLAVENHQLQVYNRHLHELLQEKAVEHFPDFADQPFN